MLHRSWRHPSVTHDRWRLAASTCRASAPASFRTVAAEARISARYLQKLFATRGRRAANIYTLRLERAAHILNEVNSTNGLPLAEIARACGYRN
jgi:transcriptional regulator GlxA family with amidase domain